MPSFREERERERCFLDPSPRKPILAEAEEKRVAEARRFREI